MWKTWLFSQWHRQLRRKSLSTPIRCQTYDPGQGHSCIWPIQYMYVPLNRVWFSGSWVLNRVYNFTSKHLEQGVFLDWKPFKERGDLRWAAYICNTNIFFLNIYFQDFSVKNYLILHAKQNKSGTESSVSCLKQGCKMSNFCLKQGRGLKALAEKVYSGLWLLVQMF